MIRDQSWEHLAFEMTASLLKIYQEWNEKVHMKQTERAHLLQLLIYFQNIHFKCVFNEIVKRQIMGTIS